ncbi:alpha/beta hydrolase [Undibacterium sp. Ren11W]|uniref:alpha/beta hydrolase n=1 Tax=Undibacterium sp. Ren11W TaxID=3413045 RepID=UPI003BF38E24
MRFSRSKSILLLALTLALSLVSPLGHTQTVVKPLVIGDSLELVSKGLGETRRINVYLPDAYPADRSRTFPVIYMLDGGLAEDFLHIAGLMQVSMANGSMRPFILVGIENTVRRHDLTGPSENALDKKEVPNLGGSALFRQFIADELIPEIEQRYRTTKERALIGESLAGLFTLECLLHAPDLFQTYIAIDPSLWWNDEALTSQFAEKLRKQPRLAKNLYFASAGQAGMANVANKFSDMLKASQVQGLHWTYENYPKESHASIYHPAALTVFRQLFAATAKTH